MKVWNISLAKERMELSKLLFIFHFTVDVSKAAAWLFIQFPQEDQ